MVVAYVSTTVPTESGVNDINDTENSILKIENVDCCLDKNGKAHRTSRYKIMNRSDNAQLVVRRGQPFVLKLMLSRSYDADIDDINIVCSLDGVQKLHQRSWQTEIQKYSDNFLEITVTPSANARIGKWNIIVVTKLKGSKKFTELAVNRPFYLLFNPWCEDDVVFLENSSEREEYVLNESGMIWLGARKQKSHINWRYAQFDDNILDCALYLITDLGKIPIAERNNPILVTRCLSAAVNNNDDYGVLVGNWSNTGDYTGGTSPLKWFGSRKILLDYYKTKIPVKYGQCWVFAGVLATVCRSLGIPCRVVTNYNSVHDRDNSLTLDFYVDENGNDVVPNPAKKDSWWNYHAWNEVWMKRMDLTPDCNGWQVLDSTPQEPSDDDTYRCGPASVAAIKRGEILRPYDSNFIYAEVNAEAFHWQYRGKNQEPKFIKKYRMGQNIITKAVGRDEPEDITHTYKYPETSKEGRAAMISALCLSEHTLSRCYLSEEFNDVVLHLEPNDDILIGQPFSVDLTIKNLNEKQTFKISLRLRVETILYTGHVVNMVKQLNDKQLIGPNAMNQVRLEVSWEEYRHLLPDQHAFRMSCYATIEDTDIKYFEQDDFCARKPDIDIKLENKPVVGEKLQATAQFKNPLPIPLTSGKFLIEVAGFEDEEQELDYDLPEDVEVEGKANCKFEMSPKSVGRMTIAVKFYSNELNDVNGFCNVMVN